MEYNTMTSLKDSDGNELTYWPISGLTAGESSEVLTFTQDIELGAESKLRATPDPRYKIWAKRTADVSYQDITVSPYDLTGLSGTIEFQVYVEALSTIVGVERVPISVGASVAKSALWKS
jgi:hypothetical protein